MKYKKIKTRSGMTVESIIKLCDIDRDQFLETLKNPPKINQNLKEAFEHYSAIRESNSCTKFGKLTLYH